MYGWMYFLFSLGDFCYYFQDQDFPFFYFLNVDFHVLLFFFSLNVFWSFMFRDGFKGCNAIALEDTHQGLVGGQAP